MRTEKKKLRPALIIPAACLLGLVLLWLFLQHLFPHFSPPFHPSYPQADLSPILAQDVLSEADYRTLFAQTGLTPTAVDDLRARGPAGLQQILDTQQAFFLPLKAPCSPLGFTTREHRFRDETGRLLFVTPLVPLKEGDILVTLSTHTAGWSHGHAGLVVDAEAGIALESVVLGSLSDITDLQHWRTYSTLLVLRPKSDDATRAQVAAFAMEHLYQIPYSLLSGVFGDKFQPVDGPHDAQCGYLPWYAWMAFGLDLDGDGGRIVSPWDLAKSPNVEILQVYGLDPARFPLEF